MYSEVSNAKILTCTLFQNPAMRVLSISVASIGSVLLFLLEQAYRETRSTSPVASEQSSLITGKVKIMGGISELLGHFF
jgi:hypothetical protein